MPDSRTMTMPRDPLHVLTARRRHIAARFMAQSLCSLCLVAAAQAAPVTAAYGTFSGFWDSTTGVVPDNRNQLLGFSVGGATYSTGVDDAALLAHNVTGFSAQRYIAFSPDALPATQTGSYIGIMRNWDGTTQGVTGVIPGSTDPLATYLTDGAQGLELGTAVFNLSAGELHFPLQLRPDALASGAPIILATQMGDPGSSDSFHFVDADDAIIGQAVPVNFSTASLLGRQNWSFYNATGSRTYATSVSRSPGRDVRMQAFTLADFGINAANIGQVAGLVQQLSGQSDSAFVAYNSLLLAANPTDLAVSVTAPATAAAGDPVNLSVTLANQGTDDASGIVVTVALPPGFTFDSSTAPAGTSYDATTGTWTVPSLPAGGSLTLALVAATGTQSGPFGAQVTRLDQVDTDPTNDSANSTVVVAAAPAPGGGTVAAVPTLDHPGLWGLMLLVVAAAARGLRRRA